MKGRIYIMSRSYRKTLLSLIAAGLTPLILLGSILSWIIHKDLRKELYQNNTEALTKIASYSDIILGESDSISLTLSSSSELPFVVADILKTGTASYYDALLYRTMKSFLCSQANSRSYIHSIYITVEGCPQRIFSTLDGVAETDSFYDMAWLDSLAFPPGQWVTLCSHRIPDSYSAPGCDVISLCRKFTVGTGGKTGTLILNLNKRDMGNTLHYTQAQGVCGILAEYNGSALFESDGDTALRWGPELNRLNESEEDFFEYEMEGETYLVSRLSSEKYGIRYYMFTKSSELYALPHTIIRTIAVSALILMLITALTLMLLSRRQHARLHQIIGMVQEESLRQNTPLPEKNYDEYEYIAQHIQDTYLLQKYLETELSEKAYKQKYTELTALQAQINPHMLYNTLETIRWKSYRLTDGRNEVVEMLESLSELLKYSLSPATSMVSLGEEIDNTVNYIRLVKLRYMEQFQIHWEYSEDIIDYATMRLILQPIIENAIHHGARANPSETTHITIRLSCTDGTIRVAVTDTGIGMQPEQLAKIQQVLSLDFAPASGMGLYNTNKRLMLQYGTQLTIRSKPGHGTTVSFSFPATPYQSPEEASFSPE